MVVPLMENNLRNRQEEVARKHRESEVGDGKVKTANLS